MCSIKILKQKSWFGLGIHHQHKIAIKKKQRMVSLRYKSEYNWMQHTKFNHSTLYIYL
jgi:hypothetical protein